MDETIFYLSSIFINYIYKNTNLHKYMVDGNIVVYNEK